MSRFIESIKCIEGKLDNIAFHHFRFNQTRKKFFGAAPLDLTSMVSVPEYAQKGIFKCRILYEKQITHIEFIPHLPRPVASLKLVENNTIEYSHKYANRDILDNLYEKRGSCDDILIVKNGFITDSYYANIIFYDGETWYTPSTPLLSGTRRAQLLCEKKINAIPIKTADLKKFLFARLINAMQDICETPSLPINSISF